MRRSPYILYALALCMMLACLSFQALTAYAETPPESDPAPGSVLVSDTELYARLDSMQQALDGIAAALAEDEPQEPAPDYTAQLDKIESALAKIDENTTPATPETSVTAFEKPFEDYTTSEVLLLCIGVVIVFAFVGLVFLRR